MFSRSNFRYGFAVLLICALCFGGAYVPPANGQTVSPLPGVLPGKTITPACGITYDFDDIDTGENMTEDPQKFGVLPVCGVAVNLGRFVDFDSVAVLQKKGGNTMGFLKNVSGGLTFKADRNVVFRASGGFKHAQNSFPGSARNYRNWHGSVAVGMSF